MCNKFVYPCCGYDCLLSDDDPAQQHEEEWCRELDEGFRWSSYPDEERWWREDPWGVLT